MDKQTERTKRSLLRRVRNQRLKYIAVLPSLITLMNGIFGFAAIIFSCKAGHFNPTAPGAEEFPYFTVACYMLGLAMVADMLDGRIARISHSTSSFGGQLDSLCDMISFGAAPAALMLGFISTKVNFNPAFNVLTHRFLWLAAAIYIGCTAIRLARFNVENEEDEASHKSFLGLPSPAAAGVVVSLVFFHEYLLEGQVAGTTIIGSILINTIVFTLPFITIGVALLMISRLTYPHIVNQYFLGRKPFAYLLWTVFLLLLIIFIFEIASAVIFCCFAASGPAKWLYHKIASLKDNRDKANDSVLTISH